jgi:hypothetical protein
VKEVIDLPYPVAVGRFPIAKSASLLRLT